MPWISPPRHFRAQAVTTPSGVPPIPIAMSMPLSGCAAAMAPATSPSMMKRTLAPAARMSSTSCLWRGRSSTTTVMSAGRTPFASATAWMFSAVDFVMSTAPTASGPTAILFM